MSTFTVLTADQYGNKRQTSDSTSSNGVVSTSWAADPTTDVSSVADRGDGNHLVTHSQQIVGASVLNVYINGALLRALSIATAGGTPDAVQTQSTSQSLPVLTAGQSSGFDAQLNDGYGNNADHSGLQFDVQAESVPYFSSPSSFLNKIGQAVALNNAPGTRLHS